MGSDKRDLDLGDAPQGREPKTVSGWDYLSKGGQVRCVFSTVRKTKLGMGSSARTRTTRILWFVEQTGEETFEARKINPHNVPAGNAEIIPVHRLVNDFTPELAHYEDVVLPAMLELEDILDQGDEYREDGRLYSAEMEYGKALGIEERNVRALFGLGLIYLTRKEIQRTRELLSELVQVKAAFDGKNQHLFNEFGIALRKSKLFPEAVVYYRRGLDFVKDDENLYYNLARAHYENGEWAPCLDALIYSHRLNPKLEQGRDLFEVIVGLSENEQRLKRYGKPPVPPAVAARARQILRAEQDVLPLDEGPVVFGAPRGRARGGTVRRDDPEPGSPTVEGFGDD
jgi:tetratricopeptide (TPR) repeat protein